MCAGCYPLDRGCDWYCGDHSLHQMLNGASSLLCGCHIPVGGRVCSPAVGVEAPRSGSKLQYEVGGTGALPLGEEPLSIPLQELSTRKCTLWCRLSLVLCAHKVHCCWHCPWPHLECWQSAWMSLRRCAHKAAGEDPLTSST